MKKKIILVLLLTLFILGPAMVSAQEKECPAPRDIMILDEEHFQEKILAPENFTGVRFSGDSKKLFVMQHGFGRPNLLIVYDLAKKELEGIHPLDVSQVSAFVPSFDGSKVFLVLDHGRMAVEYNLKQLETVVVYEKKKDGFRFERPIFVSSDKAGLVWTRGYFLKDDKNQGDFLVSFETGTNEEATIKKQVDLWKLIDNTKYKNDKNAKIVSLFPSPFAAAVAYVIQNKIDSGTVYLSKPRLDKYTQLEDGKVFTSLSLSNDGKKLVYGIMTTEDKRELVVYDFSENRRRVIARGSYIQPFMAPQGDLLMVSQLNARKSSQKIFYGTEEDKWELKPMKINGWQNDAEDRVAIYQLAPDGRTFFIWSKDSIIVGKF